MRTTNHPLEPEELMAYLDGELTADRAARAADHLRGCHDCQEIAADLRGVSDRLLEWRVEIPAMAAPQGKMPVIRRPIYRRPFAWVLAAVPCSLGVMMIVAVSLTSRRADHVSPEPVRGYVMAQHAAGQFPATTEYQAADKDARPVSQPEPAAPLIAHSARLEMVAHSFDRSRDSLQEILKRHHGYIAQLTVNAEQSSARYLEATIKTPAAQLDATMTEIKSLGKVLSETRTGEEVTQKSLDLDARLVNARNTEQRLTDLLKHRTDKLADILTVENQISETRGQIEQMEAERKNLNNRIQYAKLDLRISEEYKVQMGNGSQSSSTKIRNAAVEGYSIVVADMLGVLTGILSYGPILLVWCGILFFPMRWAWRRIHRDQTES